jgi:hypothetical protein
MPRITGHFVHPKIKQFILMIGAILMLWSSNATAQERLAVGHCVADLGKLCPGILHWHPDLLRACAASGVRKPKPAIVFTSEPASFRNSAGRS